MPSLKRRLLPGNVSVRGQSAVVTAIGFASNASLARNNGIGLGARVLQNGGIRTALKRRFERAFGQVAGRAMRGSVGSLLRHKVSWNVVEARVS